MLKKNIFVIDDSALMRRVLSDIINSDERFHVEAVASNGLEGLNILSGNPSLFDLIILDINMPVMDGIEFLEAMNKKGMKNKVLVVSMLTKEGAAITIKCLEYGAFDFVRKPSSYGEAGKEHFRKIILDRVEAAIFGSYPDQKHHSEHLSSWQALSVKKNREETDGEAARKPLDFSADRERSIKREPYGRYTQTLGKKPKINGTNKLVALACSTGGPKSLQSVIPFLPKGLDAPFLLVQHMPKGFTFSLAERLNELSNLNVKEAEDGDVLEKGKVYIAKGGFQMRVYKGSDGKYHLSVTDEPARGGLKPCADIMYESLAQLDFDEVTCVVLTGMGGDGSKGIKEMSQNNQKIYVIAQDEETSTVYGMPKTIYQAGLVNEVLPLKKIANAITEHVGVR